MTAVIRCIRSECQKFRHTFMLGIHLLIPLAAAFLFLAYFTVSPWEPNSKISAYLETLGVSFPLIIGLICGKAIEQEGQAGGFQTMLCVGRSRAAAYAGKLIILLLLGFFSITLAVGVFAVGYRTAPYFVYWKAAGLLLTGSVFLYMLHLFISFRFGRGASIGLGILESLVSALALTGLGDGIWYYVPCTWSARLCDNLVYSWVYPESAVIGTAEIGKWLVVAVPATIAALIFSFLWFEKWEGKEER